VPNDGPGTLTGTSTCRQDEIDFPEIADQWHDFPDAGEKVFCRSPNQDEVYIAVFVCGPVYNRAVKEKECSLEKTGVVNDDVTNARKIHDSSGTLRSNGVNI
jgi:hypothetical protein